MIDQKRLVESFMQYVQISSPTRSEKEFAEFLKMELEMLGLSVEMDDTMEETGSNCGNLLATLKGDGKGEPIIFSCHMDTVSPGVGVKPILADGVIRSDGTTILGGDNKAGIAAIVEAIRVIKENNIPHGDIHLAFSVYEEGGLKGAKALDYSRFGARHAFVLDSGGDPGQVIVQGPAQDKLNFTVKGKAAHAGVAPEEGISAIMIAAEAIANMKLLRIDSETTANIGRIEGGSVTNIVTEEVYVTAEARSLVDHKLEAQSKHMIDCFEKAAQKFGGSVEVEHNRMYSSFKVDENDEIVRNVFDAFENMGIKAFTQASGGGSDTNIINGKGITAINLGIGERKAHSLDEHMYVKDLVSSAQLVVEIVKRYHR
ncbi:MAG: M20/M25/M40 family metallo-hydrolase [Peptostreptococcaceae bacterium]|nr:M20/M25/M40 family metallo-hydrolase [Peptostreptococcaceae bacterium]